jgi:tetratricopeptide (TPR) repeat protein
MYLKLLVYPHPLLFYYGYNTIPVVGLENIWVLLSIVIHISLLVYAVLKFRERHLLSFAIFFYLIVISMYSNIVKQPTGIIAERFLYIASLGFSIALAYFIFVITKTETKKSATRISINKALLVSLIILIPFTARTIVRNKDWNSQLSLFSHDIKYLNNSAKANYIYATTLKTELIEQLNAGNQDGTEVKVEKIVGLLRQTVKIYPGYFEAWNSLGEMYAMMKSDYDSALIYFKRAVKEKPTFAAGWYNLGYAYFQKEDFYQALYNFRKVAQLDTTNIKALSNLAMCYNKNGLIDSAIFTNNKIISKMPSIEIPYLNNASFYLARRDSINAILWLEKAAVINPNNTSVTTILSKYYAGKGNKEKADLYSSLNNKAQKQP